MDGGGRSFLWISTQQHMVAMQLLSKFPRALAQDHFVEGADVVCGVEGEGHTVGGVVAIIPE